MLLGNSTTFLSSGASCGVGDSSVCVNVSPNITHVDCIVVC